MKKHDKLLTSRPKQLSYKIPVESLLHVFAVFGRVLPAKRRPQLSPDRMVGRPAVVAQHLLDVLLEAGREEALDLAERLEGLLLGRQGTAGERGRRAERRRLWRYTVHVDVGLVHVRRGRQQLLLGCRRQHGTVGHHHGDCGLGVVVDGHELGLSGV